MKRAVVGGVVLAGLLSVHCSAAPTAEGEGATTSKMVSAISSSYGITTFGGAGDFQAMACGGNSQTADQWYVASSQRYGCHVHLQLTTSDGKCVVVSTEDAGPATFVENDAGMPILDSSPAVAQYLFGQSELGWSDVKANPSGLSVSASTTTLPVGPCSGSSDSTNDTSTSTPAPAATTGDDDDDGPAQPTFMPSGGGQQCGSDGQCNLGNDGSGLICEDGQCVPGCHFDAQCPDDLVCVDGDCE